MSLQAIQNTQHIAISPYASAWVAASAGSGKTKVLTDRVLNIMLNGTLPERILCLTFTKAAAAEMSNRLMEKLGNWAILSDEALIEEIKIFLGRLPTSQETERARTLFTLVIDNSDGPKIQTIHGFCQVILKRFPLEAGVSPYFEVADEKKTRELLMLAQQKLTLSSDPHSQEALKYLASQISEMQLIDLNEVIITGRQKFQSLLSQHLTFAQAMDHLKNDLNFSGEEDEEQILKKSLSQVPFSDLKIAIECLNQGTRSEQERAEALRRWILRPFEACLAMYENYLSIFLTLKGEGRLNIVSEKTTSRFPQVKEILFNEAQRLQKFEVKRKKSKLFKYSRALLRYASAFLEEYTTLKNQQGLLDYDDLILKTASLLSLPGSSPWVLYKLDGGLDHILIDEAQDTSPDQWQVISNLAEEFFSNSGREATLRTLFVVGDIKQSIYSFQGADPSCFGVMKKHFKNYADEASQRWHNLDLNISFRSTPEVLKAVDLIFSSPRVKSSFGHQSISHIPFRNQHSGLVEVWPLIRKELKPDDKPWHIPLKRVHEELPHTRLARLIAQTINDWIKSRKYIPAKQRSIQPGDILVLVRKRSGFVEDLTRYLKELGVPVAGRDRMVLLEQLAVQDLLKLAEFLLLPEDDLTLAIVLKGPLFSLSEDDLFTLAYQRKKASIWQRLRKLQHLNPSFHHAYTILMDLLNRVDRITPFALFSYVLSSLNGRKLWHARLGPEALDPLDELLSLCLKFEQEHQPILQGFIQWIYHENIELKRDLDQSDQVRIMTVHGSKGLQAPIVFLPDTVQMQATMSKIFWSDDKKSFIWQPCKELEVFETKTLKQIEEKKQEEENLRLLYVALTRAEDHLYICGWTGQKSISEKSWYSLIYQALVSHSQKVSFNFKALLNTKCEGDGLRLSAVHKEKVSQELEIDFEKATSRILVPKWASNAPLSEPEVLKPLAPSYFTNKEVLKEGNLTREEGGRHRGIIIHRLLEKLPELSLESQYEKAVVYLRQQGLQKESTEIATKLVNIVREFSFLFEAGSLAEVSIVGKVGPYIINGQIDRLVVYNSTVYIVDYKSQSTAPSTLEDIPIFYKKQLAAYKEVIKKIYPKHSIKCGLLWTSLPRLDFIPDELINFYE